MKNRALNSDGCSEDLSRCKSIRHCLRKHFLFKKCGKFQRSGGKHAEFNQNKILNKSQLQKSERTVLRAHEMLISLVVPRCIPIGLCLGATSERRASSAATRRAITPYGGMSIFQSEYDAPASHVALKNPPATHNGMSHGRSDFCNWL